MMVMMRMKDLVLRDSMHEGRRFYVLEKEDGTGTQLIFAYEDLLHLRRGAALFDRHAETDAVYNGPNFTAVRTCRPPVFFGVKLRRNDDESHELFFHGEDWNAFLDALDALRHGGQAA